MNEQRINKLADWINDHDPDLFITINLPAESQGKRDPQFYLSLWTRAVEAILLGPSALKARTQDRRFLWFARREVSAKGLIHYHIIGKSPLGMPWRGLPGSTNLANPLRCPRVKSALLRAYLRTPKPFGAPNTKILFDGMIDVRPYKPEHAAYLLKGFRYIESHDGERTTDELMRDSGLIILPHPLKKGTLNANRTPDAGLPDRVPCHTTGTRAASPRRSRR